MIHEIPYGRWLEEIQVGDVYLHGSGRTLVDWDNVWSSLTALENDPLYIDVEYAKSLGHPRCPVNPMLIFSICIGLSVADVSGRGIGNLGYDSLVQHKHVYPGDTLYSRSTVLEVRRSQSKPDRGPVYVRSEALDQNGELVLSVNRRTMVRTRPAGEAGSFFLPNSEARV